MTRTLNPHQMSRSERKARQARSRRSTRFCPALPPMIDPMASPGPRRNRGYEQLNQARIHAFFSARTTTRERRKLDRLDTRRRQGIALGASPAFSRRSRRAFEFATSAKKRR